MLQFDSRRETTQFRLRLRESNNKFCFPHLQLDKQRREQWQRLRQKAREDDSAGEADEATGLAGRVQQQEFIIDASKTRQQHTNTGT